jgi:hypothetical protein
VAHNLLWGQFERPGQHDLVVLCAQGSLASLYVFWGGDVGRLEELPFGGAGDTITAGTADDILGHAAPNARIDEAMPQRIDHEAIEVGTEKGSIYYYRYQDRWFAATGAD